MRAVTIKDEQLSVQEHPDPVPGDGEVLVRVHAAGLNGADMHQLAGHYPAPPGSPRTSRGWSWPARCSIAGPGPSGSTSVTALCPSSAAAARASWRWSTSGP